MFLHGRPQVLRPWILFLRFHMPLCGMKVTVCPTAYALRCFLIFPPPFPVKQTDPIYLRRRFLNKPPLMWNHISRKICKPNGQCWIMSLRCYCLFLQRTKYCSSFLSSRSRKILCGYMNQFSLLIQTLVCSWLFLSGSCTNAHGRENA